VKTYIRQKKISRQKKLLRIYASIEAAEMERKEVEKKLRSLYLEARAWRDIMPHMEQHDIQKEEQKEALAAIREEEAKLKMMKQSVKSQNNGATRLILSSKRQRDSRNLNKSIAWIEELGGRREDDEDLLEDYETAQLMYPGQDVNSYEKECSDDETDYVNSPQRRKRIEPPRTPRSPIVELPASPMNVGEVNKWQENIQANYANDLSTAENRIGSLSITYPQDY
jgi:hypothetical protein